MKFVREWLIFEESRFLLEDLYIKLALTTYLPCGAIVHADFVQAKMSMFLHLNAGIYFHVAAIHELSLCGVVLCKS